MNKKEMAVLLIKQNGECYSIECTDCDDNFNHSLCIHGRKEIVMICVEYLNKEMIFTLKDIYDRN